MLNKELKFNQDARDLIQKGINTVADAVKVTLGPKGNCVVLGDLEKQPHVTKDGVSVAREVQLRNTYENAGAQLIKEAAEKTLSTVGDSTTTSTVLAQSLINLGADALKTYNAVKLQKGLNKGCERALKFIKEHTITITDDDIKNIATISANNDKELGSMIADAFKKIGRDGVITVEESSNINTSVDVVAGMQIDRGYLSQHFVTDYVKDTCVLDNPYILITEEKVNNARDLGFLLNHIASEGRPILLIAEDFDGEVLETLKLNKLQGILKICAIKAPSFGEYRKSLLDDIAVFTNGNSITYESGLEIRDISISQLGQCKKVVVTKDTTTFIGGKGSKDSVNNRVIELKAELDRIKKDSTKDGSFMIDFLQQRIAKLTGGVACIYVGGITEIEMRERKDRVEDAVAATKAAIEEGVVLGGGLTYFNASKALSDIKDKDDAIQEGILLVQKALLQPFYQIVINAGFEPSELTSQLTDKIGFDANTENFVDMYKSGIIDPAKAAKIALQNAISVASLFLSIQCIIVPEPINQFVM